MDEKEYIKQIREFKKVMEEQNENHKKAGTVLGTAEGISTANSEGKTVAH